MAQANVDSKIEETVSRKYEESLMKDIDEVFRSSYEDTQEANEGNDKRIRGSRVLTAAQAYEEKLGLLLNRSVPVEAKNVKKAWKGRTNGAIRKPPIPSKPKFGKTLPREKRQEKEEAEIKEEKSSADKIEGKAKAALHKIAKELLSTEETYVSVLHLLDQVFHKKLLKLCIESDEVPESVINTIFQHLSAIYVFHSNFLLPQLRSRLDEWDSNPQIGDIMIKAGPFLKMYGLYLKNLECARETINVWMEKSTEFAKVVNEIHALPECKALPLQEHMLNPVQRTPRYQMLLEDFCKKLPEDSPLKDDVQKALKLIVTAANHSNEFMKTTEKSLNLVKVYNNLAYIDFDIEDMTRELIKEGNMTKVAARNGRGHNRYLYLFSDMLLCCKESVAFHKLQGKNHKVAARIDLLGMTTASIENEFFPNVFCVHGVQKSIEFSCSTSEEKDEWLTAIDKAIKDRLENENSFRRMGSVSKSTLRANSSPRNSLDLRTITNQSTNLLEVPVIQNPNFISLREDELGTRAPHWIKDQDVTMCMICSEAFRTIIRRRHHCRACGWVICNGCSSNKIILPYDTTSSAQKVCDKCFSILSKRKESDSSEFESTTSQSDIISLYGSNLLAGSFFYAENGTWISLWCIVPPDEPLIYCYKARRDVKAHLIINLTGSHVTLGTDSEYKYMVKIHEASGNLAVLATNEEEVVNAWTEVISQIIEREEDQSSRSEFDDEEEQYSQEEHDIVKEQDVAKEEDVVKEQDVAEREEIVKEQDDEEREDIVKEEDDEEKKEDTVKEQNKCET